MTTEREEALELALEAGFDEFQGQRDNNEIDYYFEGWPEHVEKLVRLAKQRGAEEQKRKDAELLERQHTWITNVAASALIRNQP